MYKFLSLGIFLLGASAFAQQRVSLADEKPRVAVLLFDVARVSDKQVFDKAGVDAFAEAATQKAVNAFVSLKRFTVIERDAIDKIMLEQNFQMGELTDPNTAAKVGNMLGTQFIVQGKIQSLITSKKENKHKTTLELNIRVIDVSTGEIKASKDIKGSSDYKKELSSKIAYDALNDAEAGIFSSIRTAFPIEGKLVRIQEPESGKKKADKKDKKTVVLISCGKNLGVNAGDRFYVVREEEITVDGKSYKRQKGIGKLKVKTLELDGIFSECEIVEGEKTIRSEMEKTGDLRVISE